MRKNLTKVLAVALAVVMLLSLCACGKPKDEGKTKIYFANYAVLEKNYTEFWNKVEVDFEAKYQQYDLEYLTAPYNDMMTFVTNRVGGGDLVDLIFGEVAWSPALAEAGVTSPVEEILDKNFIDDFYPEVIGNFTYENKYYGVPCYFTPAVMFINKDHAAKVGLDINNPPKTQEELMEWCKKLSVLKTDAGEPVYPIGLPYAEKTAPGAYVNSVITAFGGQVLDDKGNLSIDNKGFDEAVDFFIELDKLGYNPKNTLPKDLRSMFANGTVSMYIDQTGALGSVATINPKANDFTYFAPFPSLGTSGTGKTLVQSHCLLMSNNGEKSAKATKDFVQFLLTADVMTNYLQNIAPYFPAKKEMANIKLPDIMNSVGDKALNVYTQVNLPQTNSLHIQLATMINSINVAGKTKTEAIAEFKKQIDILLRK